jgi:hypothetical protein
MGAVGLLASACSGGGGGGGQASASCTYSCTGGGGGSTTSVGAAGCQGFCNTQCGSVNKTCGSFSGTG